MKSTFWKRCYGKHRKTALSEAYIGKKLRMEFKKAFVG